MKLFRISFVLLLLLGVFFVACEKAEYGDPVWNVGDWAEYKVEGSSLGGYTLRYAVTGIDTVKGEPYYWLEMIGTSGPNQFVYKMLVPYGYRGVAEKMIIKVAEQPALEMPNVEGLAEEPPGENRPYLYLPDDVTKGRIDDAKIKVPAGEFLTVHSKIKDPKGNETEVWLRKDIPVFGLVAQKTSLEEMKLVATGNDAVTAITEEPQKIDPMIFAE